MAIIKLHGNKGMEIDHDKARAIWLCMSGEQEPTPEQERFIEQIQDIYLNRYADDVPASYLKARAHVHARMDAGTKAVKAPGMTWADK